MQQVKWKVLHLFSRVLSAAFSRLQRGKPWKSRLGFCTGLPDWVRIVLGYDGDTGQIRRQFSCGTGTKIFRLLKSNSASPTRVSDVLFSPPPGGAIFSLLYQTVLTFKQWNMGLLPPPPRQERNAYGRNFRTSKFELKRTVREILEKGNSEHDQSSRG